MRIFFILERPNIFLLTIRRESVTDIATIIKSVISYKVLPSQRPRILSSTPPLKVTNAHKGALSHMLRTYGPVVSEPDF